MKCSVLGCRNNSSILREKSFFRFPKEEELAKKWIRAIRRKSFIPTKYSVICSDHFLPSEKQRLGNCNHLLPDAIPSVNIKENILTISGNKIENKILEIPKPIEDSNAELKIKSLADTGYSQIQTNKNEKVSLQNKP